MFKIKTHYHINFTALLLLICLLTGCNSQSPNIKSATRDNLLGTTITISIYDNIPDSLFDTIITQCFDTINDIEARMSVNRADSEISRLNENHEGAFPVSDDIYELIKNAIQFSYHTTGAFDISVGSVMELWKQDGDFIFLPSPIDIIERLTYVGYKAISFPADNKISIPTGMKLDLGAFAKGHALEVVRGILIKNGIKHAILDFGGDIFTLGKKPDGSNYRVAIKTPIIGDNSLVCIVEVSDLSVMTSGGYERYFEQDNAYYHHILDPATGYPANNKLLSVTVISPDPIGADALSTAGFVLGLEKGMNLINELEGYEAIFITEEKEIYVTDGLHGAVTVLNEGFRKISYN